MVRDVDYWATHAILHGVRSSIDGINGGMGTTLGAGALIKPKYWAMVSIIPLILRLHIKQW